MITLAKSGKIKKGWSENAKLKIPPQQTSQTLTWFASRSNVSIHKKKFKNIFYCRIIEYKTLNVWDKSMSTMLNVTKVIYINAL